MPKTKKGRTKLEQVEYVATAGLPARPKGPRGRVG